MSTRWSTGSSGSEQEESLQHVEAVSVYARPFEPSSKTLRNILTSKDASVLSVTLAISPQSTGTVFVYATFGYVALNCCITLVGIVRTKAIFMCIPIRACLT